MIVIADTSPLHYRIQIDCDNLLPRMYGRIVVPGRVIAEMGHIRAPHKVRAWQAQLPERVSVVSMHSPPDAGLGFLGRGEREAIQLAEEFHAELILIDERKGRLEAKRRGLETTGTLGVLFSAGELGLIEPKPGVSPPTGRDELSHLSSS